MILITGLSAGVVVGLGIASFITLLDIVPRLAQISNSKNLIRVYQIIMIVSIVVVSLLQFLNISINLNKYILIPIGLFFGIYVGLLAAALAEVLNVIPVLVNRLNIKEYVYYCILSTALGKVLGSVFDWIIIEGLNLR